MVIARKKLEGISEQALARFAARARRTAKLEGSIEILLTDNSEMRKLNRQFRRKDKPTDVLSFPSAELKLPHSLIARTHVTPARARRSL